MKKQQFIGLNYSAQEYVRNKEEIPVEENLHYTIDGGSLPLRSWWGTHNGKRTIIREKLQIQHDTMIFTCLEVGSNVECFKWTVEPNVFGSSKYNQIRGLIKP